MINVKKGTAHSLQQSDLRGNAITGVIAGSVVHVDSTGTIALGGNGSTGLRGLAINNSIDGDVIESGKIALYTFDGNSVIETDQTDTDADGALNASTYPVGTPLYASTNMVGTVTKTGSVQANGPVIGWVEGVRLLQNATPFPSGFAKTQDYKSATEAAALANQVTTGNTAFPSYTSSTKNAAYKPQVNVPVLGIKLAATN